MRNKIDEHIRVAEALRDQVPTLEAISETIVDCFRRGGRLYILGNGGSAADAQHIAAEFVGRFKLDRQALPAIALTTDTSALTAISNDLGGDVIFSRQVEALVRPGDVVWMLSVSGTSPNVIAAAKAAQARDAVLIGFTSLRGNALAEFCTHTLRAGHRDSDRVQEMHLLAYHLICEQVENIMAETP